MRYLRVRNHEKFQHYRNRTPPWIKWHSMAHESRRFNSLPDASRFHAVCCAVLASREGNHLAPDAPDIAYKMRTSEPVDLQILLDIEFLEWCDCDECKTQAKSGVLTSDASNMLAKASNLLDRGERGEEREREEGRGVSSLLVGSDLEQAYVDTPPDASKALAKASKLLARRVDACWKTYEWAHETYYREKNGSAPRKPGLTTKRRKLIGSAIKTHGYQKAEAAPRGMFQDPFCTGANKEEREWLTPEIAWRMNSRRDNVEYFASLVPEGSEFPDPAEEIP